MDVMNRSCRYGPSDFEEDQGWMTFVYCRAGDEPATMRSFFANAITKFSHSRQ